MSGLALHRRQSLLVEILWEKTVVVATAIINAVLLWNGYHFFICMDCSILCSARCACKRTCAHSLFEFMNYMNKSKVSCALSIVCVLLCFDVCLIVVIMYALNHYA